MSIVGEYRAQKTTVLRRTTYVDHNGQPRSEPTSFETLYGEWRLKCQLDWGLFGELRGGSTLEVDTVLALWVSPRRFYDDSSFIEVAGAAGAPRRYIRIAAARRSSDPPRPPRTRGN